MDANKLQTSLPHIDKSTSAHIHSTNLSDTPCPNCQTRFSIHSTQLHARQGLVRCGLCLHIFNALIVSQNRVPHPNHTSYFFKNKTKKTRMLAWCSYLFISGISLTLALILFFRNTVIQYFPNSAAILQPICHVLSCSLSPAHDIDAVEIMHSELLKGKDAETYILRIVLQNRANFIVSLPALEISLISHQGQLIFRRILNPQDYLSTANIALTHSGLKENTSLPLEIVLHSKETAVSYQLFSFYP